MRKIFTLLGGLLLATGLTANAETVTLQVCTSKGVEVAKSSETELTRNDKGNYVIANFLESGSPVAFTFDSTADSKTPIELKGNIEEDGAFIYLVDSDGEDMICKITPLEGEESFNMYYPFMYYGQKYSYVSPLDKTEDEYDYMARFSVSGYDENSAELDYYYIYMYFNEIPFEGSGEEEPGEEEDPVTVLETIDVTVYNDGYYYPDYDGDEETYTEKEFKPFNAKLEIKEDGTYTLKDIFGTDYSISYKLGTYNPKNQALITYIDNIYVPKDYSSDYPYFVTPDKAYMTVPVEDENGEKMEVEYLNGNQGKYSYVLKSTEAQIAEGDDQYYVYIYVSGYIVGSETAGVDMYLYFGYNPKSTGVAKAEVTENAPAEYYNLQGVKVAEPSNGIFIRRQGSKTSKIAIK